MSNKTTVPQLVLENFPHIQRTIKFPDDLDQNDLQKMHDFLFPILMRDFRSEWEATCDEVDQMLEEGLAAFNTEDGTITLL